MVSKRVFLWLVYILPPVFGLGVATLNFIPSWQNIQTYTIFALFLLPGFLYLIRLWIKNYKNRKHIKPLQWLKSALITIVLGFIFLIAYLVAMFSGIDYPEPNEIKIKSLYFYTYEYRCFPPDSRCECDNYGSSIYIKNKYLPIMHLIKQVNFYVDTIEQVNNKVIVKASATCERDKNKKAVINIE